MRADKPAAEPMPLQEQALLWTDETATEAWAVALAKRLRAVSPACDAVIELDGPLGAGKTTLVRHLLRALGVTGRIKSPSYAIVEPYALPGEGPDAAPVSIAHFDFYRFGDPREWEDAGLRELFAAPGLKLLEWPDKVRAHLPTPDLRCCIGLRVDGGRDVLLSAHTPLGQQLLSPDPVPDTGTQT